jgi:uncharacterized protein YbaP (TraB family)
LLNSSTLLRVGLLAVLALAGCGDKPPEQPFSDARLWRIERDGAEPSFILGTMHVTDPDVTALSPAIEQAFDGSRTLVVELTMDAATQVKLAKAMIASDFAWMDRRLDERQRQLLTEVAGQYDIAVTQLRLLEPWAVAAMFSFPPAELQRQMSGTKPLDLQLMDKAKASGKKLVALETVEEQLSAFTDYSEQEQIQMLTQTLESVSRIEKDFARVKDAYLRSNLTDLNALADEGFAELGPALSGRIQQRLIGDRNRRMAERLEALLDEGQVFVAVGALHLPGEGGVLNLLAQRGYRITAVE